MVFLRRLTIKGFKSFADSATLDMEPGVTVVVGPNGSGKSNIVDAIAWVLGAQAPSAVRSQKMDDVIFAGTATRAALGRAEVSLTIDNGSGMLPVEFSEVTITRTLFRSGDSDYAINGAPCRLLDIQELLSDVGVGRQQHVIISQGQIDAVLNARPEERRAIIEDAAGILKYRKRKERAERRLRSTEANVDRLGDLMREVRRQLRPLECQADAARRHGDLLHELTALRRHRAGRELAGLRLRAGDEAQRRSELSGAEAGHSAELGRLDADVTVSESELASSGGDDLGDRLARCEALRERVRGMRALLAERLRGIERDRGAYASQQMVVGLEAELARSEAELEGLDVEAGALVPAAESLALAESDLAAERARFELEWADAMPVPGGPVPGGDAARARGELGVLRTAVARVVAERVRFADRLGIVDAAAVDMDVESERLRSGLVAGITDEEPLVDAVAELEERSRLAALERNAAWEHVVAAEADLRAGRVRVDALALALAEARFSAGVAHLADVEGVLGTLLDLVEVDPGFEAAFEAAAGEALDAVVVDGVDTARQALQALRAGEFCAAVLPLRTEAVGRSAPTVGEPVRPHVRARVPGVDELLDRLLGHAVLVDGGAAAAVDVALANPEAVVVTVEGDRFGPSGWRIGGDRRGATGAALAAAEGRLAEAEVARVEAQSVFDAAESRTAELDAEVELRTRDLDEFDERFAASTEALQALQAEQANLGAEAEALRARIGELDQRFADETARVSDHEGRLPALEAVEHASLEAGRKMTALRGRLEARSASVGAQRIEHEVRTADVTGRQAMVHARVSELHGRLGGLVDERAAAAIRCGDLDRREAATRVLMSAVDVRVVRIDAGLEALRQNRRLQSERIRSVVARLDGLRRDRSAAEASLRGTRDQLSRLEIQRAETRMRLENLNEAIRSEFDLEPDSVLDSPCPELAEGVGVSTRVVELERELKLMGPVNPLALEEFDALEERRRFLQEQLDDIRATRTDLRKVIRSVDDEIVSVFARAFAEVSTHFTEFFDKLFPGGQGRLRLVDPDHLLDTGLEIEARPSGKNVRKLSLLSGGERSLTALAFLFAVFRSRPSPFYVMDEVEAALDDVNLHRFLGLVDRFREDAQLLIVSHQKRTMEAADCLYGVSMAPGGSSTVVSERVRVDRASDRLEVLAGS